MEKRATAAIVVDEVLSSAKPAEFSGYLTCLGQAGGVIAPPDLPACCQVVRIGTSGEAYLEDYK
jgi:hypothetical protein